MLTVLLDPLYRRGFTIHLCRDLYIVYAINACDNFNYFSLSLLFTLYLTEEFGFTDQEVILPINLVCHYLIIVCNHHLDCQSLKLAATLQTGVLYGLWGCAITAFGFAFGGVVDFLGERRCFDKATHLALISIETQVSTCSATKTFCLACRGQENAVHSLYLDRLWQVKVSLSCIVS